MLAVADNDRLSALYKTGLMLGLRPGELLGLAWDNIDFDNGVLRVTQALKRERGELIIGEQKTASSRRALLMPTPVIEALETAPESISLREGGGADMGER